MGWTIRLKVIQWFRCLAYIPELISDFSQCIGAVRFVARSGQQCTRFFPTGYVQVYDMAVGWESRLVSSRFSTALRLHWHIGLLPSCSCATRRVNQKSCCNLRRANQTHTENSKPQKRGLRTPYSGFSCITPISLLSLECCHFFASGNSGNRKVGRERKNH